MIKIFQILHELSLISIRAKLLTDEMRHVAMMHDIIINGSRLANVVGSHFLFYFIFLLKGFIFFLFHVNFSYAITFTSYHRHLMFSLLFHTDLANYPDMKPTVEFRNNVGNMT